jgi:hypothetical protein
MKDINKILTKAHFKCNFFYNDAKKQHFFAETCLYEYAGDLCHAFTSLSCFLREKSSLPIFRESGEPCKHNIIDFYVLLWDVILDRPDKSLINILCLICFAQNRLLIASHIPGSAFNATWIWEIKGLTPVRGQDGKISDTQGKDFWSPTMLRRVGDH